MEPIGTPPVEDKGVVAPGSGQGEQSDDFFSVELPGEKGPEKHTYKTREELEKDFRGSYMMRSDYTKKTQGIAEERKRHEAERILHAQQVADFEEKRKGYAKYDEIDSFLKQNPSVMKILSEKMKNPSGQDIAGMVESIMESKYGSKIKEVDEWKAKQEYEKQKSAFYDSLKQELPDFDGAAVDEAYTKLAQGNMGDMARILHYALKGQNIDPAKVEQQIVENLEKKKSAGLAPAKGGQAGSTPRQLPKKMESLTKELLSQIRED